MLKNDIQKDIKILCEKEKKTQTELALQLGVTKQYINRVANGNQTVVTKSFLELCEALGYDIEIVYHAKET